MQTPDRSVIVQRIAAVRQAMASQQIAALLVPSSDPHLSEYLPAHWQAREWLSGFTGSAGTLIVTADFAGLWTDARYWSQAETELEGSGLVLMKLTSSAGLQYIDWLAGHLRTGQTVAVDGAVLGLSTARLLAATLEQHGIALNSELDLAGQVWNERPPLPGAAVYEHLPPHAMLGRADKLAALRRALEMHGASCHLISTLDDIAYLFNLRGADVSYNPVFLAHALIDARSATLFVAEGKIGPELAATLGAAGVTLAPYGALAGALAALPPDGSLLLDPRRITWGTRQAVPAALRVVEAVNPTTFAKSRKTAAEAEQVRATMEQDGIALCEFFAWLDDTLADSRHAPLSELDIHTRLTAERARRPGFVSPSFATIAGFRANGAVMHYRATEAAHAMIEGDGLLLIDSGGQYLGGTTDITRVVPVGAVTAEQRRDFTLVLKSLIALSAAHFPRAVRAPMLDAIARAPLWAEGIDFGHGTGHGVGYFLNVHEGPQAISPSAMPEPHTAMEAGMITSIEPGIYRPGKWGIRIENLVLNVAAESSAFGDFLRFETLTLCPIDSRCIDAALLRADERDWLNAYHASVRRRLRPQLSGAALAWLIKRTEAL